ncbi:MAG: 3-deoxy-D-manno-octulosonic acid transferase [Fimbriiglobus sp.]
MPHLFDLLYLFAVAVGSPWLLWRAVRTGRYRTDLRAKLLGPAFVPNPDRRPVTWFHGVSVGEIHLLGVLVAAFRARHPGWLVVVSSTTDAGLSEARRRFPDLPVIPFPFDFSWAVGRALGEVNPAVVVLAESELWPNFLAACGRRCIPVVVANARMSPRSFARLTRVKAAARRFLFRHVSAFGAQTAEYADRLRGLGASGVEVTGSVKYDGALRDRGNPATAAMAKLLGLASGGREPPVFAHAKTGGLRPPLAGASSLLWLAGSTSAPEEVVVLAVFARLRVRFPMLRLLLVPRHPERFDEVAKLVESTGLPFVRRSRVTEPLPEMPAVVLLDRMGELAAAWGLADVGFTGGSLGPKRGGQSMIEPAGYGVPVAFGPEVWNFRDTTRLLLDADAAVMVRDEAELEAAISALLEDPARRERMGAAARELVRAQQGATDRTLNLIDRAVTAFHSKLTRNSSGTAPAGPVG